MRPLNRMPVKAPSQFFDTFSIRAPKSTHWTRAVCEEVQCLNYTKGFKVTVLTDSPQAHYIRHDTTRTCTENRLAEGMVEFEYKPGQRCFAEHTKRLDKPEVFTVRGGDHRGNPRGTRMRTHTKAEFWVEEFAETQDKIIKALERRD